MVDRSAARNLYLGTRDMKPGLKADQEKANRRLLVAKVASRTHTLADTIKAIAAFDAAGNTPAILQQITAVAEDLNAAVDDLLKSMYGVCDAAGLTRSVPVRVVVGDDVQAPGGLASGGQFVPNGEAGMTQQFTYHGSGFPDGIDLSSVIAREHRKLHENTPISPGAPVRVNLDETVPTPLQVARDHIDRERRAGQ